MDSETAGIVTRAWIGESVVDEMAVVKVIRTDADEVALHIDPGDQRAWAVYMTVHDAERLDLWLRRAWTREWERDG